MNKIMNIILILLIIVFIGLTYEYITSFKNFGTLYNELAKLDKILKELIIV